MPPQKQSPTKTTKTWDWKSWVGLAIGVIGLILGALVVESRPTISLEPPTNPDNILSTQVVISNDGALPLEDVDVGVFIRNIISDSATGNLYRVLGTRYAPPSREMDIGTKKTVPLAPFSYGAGAPITSADIGLIVCYRPVLVPEWLWRKKPRVFRLDAVLQSDGKTRLRQQPPDDKMLSEYTTMLAEHGRTLCAPQ